MKNTFFVILFGTALVCCQNLLAQDSPEAAPTGGHAPQFAPRSIEDLNLIGADIQMPPFSDTVLGADSPYRRALYSEGFVLRNNTIGFLYAEHIESACARRAAGLCRRSAVWNTDGQSHAHL